MAHGGRSIPVIRRRRDECPSVCSNEQKEQKSCRFAAFVSNQSFIRFWQWFHFYVLQKEVHPPIEAAKWRTAIQCGSTKDFHLFHHWISPTPASLPSFPPLHRECELSLRVPFPFSSFTFGWFLRNISCFFIFRSLGSSCPMSIFAACVMSFAWVDLWQHLRCYSSPNSQRLLECVSTVLAFALPLILSFWRRKNRNEIPLMWCAFQSCVWMHV